MILDTCSDRQKEFLDECYKLFKKQQAKQTKRKKVIKYANE